MFAGIRAAAEKFELGAPTRWIDRRGSIAFIGTDGVVQKNRVRCAAQAFFELPPTLPLRPPTSLKHKQQQEGGYADLLGI